MPQKKNAYGKGLNVYADVIVEFDRHLRSRRLSGKCCNCVGMRVCHGQSTWDLCSERQLETERAFDLESAMG